MEALAVEVLAGKMYSTAVHCPKILGTGWRILASELAWLLWVGVTPGMSRAEVDVVLLLLRATVVLISLFAKLNEFSSLRAGSAF